MKPWLRVVLVVMILAGLVLVWTAANLAAGSTPPGEIVIPLPSPEPNHSPTPERS